MNLDPLPAVPGHERFRGLLVALWSKAVELLVVAKVRLQRGAPGKFDRWAMGAIHGLMLRQLGRMRHIQAAVRRVAGPAATAVGVHNAKVILSPSDSAWRLEAGRETSALLDVLGAQAEVHHIGSTAIADLAAKPIVDLAVTLPGERLADEFGALKVKLQSLGYRYLGVRGGHFFEKGAALVRTHALQVHPEGHRILCELLRFRDALRADEALRLDYEATKRALAAFFPDRRLFYVFYKAHWIDDWQWRHSGESDWTNWFIGQKRAHARLARDARRSR